MPFNMSQPDFADFPRADVSWYAKSGGYQDGVWSDAYSDPEAMNIRVSRATARQIGSVGTENKRLSEYRNLRLDMNQTEGRWFSIGDRWGLEGDRWETVEIDSRVPRGYFRILIERISE